ncbi:MAG: hypothetical protein IKO99_00375 [Bacteroidales bacterium]|nr:hypothetical protein [Bacteroidales bacterium]MBR4676439.1 hypothetical protein [Bacteroidales bacterium]
MEIGIQRIVFAVFAKFFQPETALFAKFSSFFAILLSGIFCLRNPFQNAPAQETEKKKGCKNLLQNFFLPVQNFSIHFFPFAYVPFSALEQNNFFWQVPLAKIENNGDRRFHCSVLLNQWT